MEKALPYAIPGPAGGFVASTQRSAASSHVQPPLLQLFQTPSWRQMLAHLNSKIPSSIALLRRNALSHDYAKLKTLPLLVDSLVHVGKDASVLLRDPTGSIRGTIHAEVFEHRKNMLSRGVVLLLNHVSALAYLDENRGFRSTDDAVHLSVQACHVTHIFRGTPGLRIAPPPSSLLDTYESAARFPKPVVKPPETRNPLRERNSYRPISRAYHDTARNRSDHAKHPNSHDLQSSSRHPPQNHAHHMHAPHRRIPYQRPLHSRQSPSEHDSFSFPSRPNSAQHKRPFRPPIMVPKASTPGMPSPAKRPAYRISHTEPSAAPRQLHPVNALSDEQFDSLLGDLDVDAMVAAHTQVSSSPNSNKMPASPTPDGRGGMPPEVSSSKRLSSGSPLPQHLSQGDASQSDHALLQAVSQRPSLTTDTPSVPPGPGLKETEIGRADVRKASLDAKHVSNSNNAASENSRQRTPAEMKTQTESVAHEETEKSTIEKVNHDMVVDLFDGLDASDFI